VAGKHRVGRHVQPGHQHEGTLVGPRVRQGQVWIVPAGLLHVDHIDVQGARPPPDVAGALRGGLTTLTTA